VRHSEPFIHKWKKAGTLEEKQKIKENIEAYVCELIYEKGIIIETHLNANIQRKASEGLKQLPSGVEGAFVVLDHNTHQVAAIIGGKNMEATEFNRAFQAYRQPGSAIKPLLAYAPFLDVTSSTLNVPIDASPYCKHGYCPQNFGYSVYSNVSIREAIGKSINTAAVRITDQIGVERAFQYVKPFHFEKVIQKDHTVASVLGGLTYGVTPLELTNAYTTFSNGGSYKPSRAIKRVLSTDGTVLFEWKEKPQRVWKKETNDKMRTLLNYVVTNGTARRAYLSSPYIGGKTGTTNDVKDLWFIGMTDRFTAGIWVGKDKPAPIRHVQRNSQHLRIWKEIMETTLR
jgi:penicillin-binding protein 1A